MTDRWIDAHTHIELQRKHKPADAQSRSNDVRRLAQGRHTGAARAISTPHTGMPTEPSAAGTEKVATLTRACLFTYLHQ